MNDGLVNGALFNGVSETARVVHELRELILRGSFTPGERLGQEMLAKRLQASRMPVRAALQQLEREELVTIVPNSGAWVTRMDAEQIDAIYRLREVIEPLVVRTSLPNLTAEQIERIHELGDKVDEVTENPERFDEFMVLEREFHIATFAGADFPGYRDRVEQLWNRTQFSRGTVACQFTAADWACTRADHHLMRYYIDNCDAEALGEIVRLHIRRTRRLGAQLELLKDQSIGSN